MAEWNQSNKSPKGKYRVIGTDTFPWPHEDYWIGDGAGLPQAKKLASAHVKEMNSVAVYDENGKLVFSVSTDDPAKPIKEAASSPTAPRGFTEVKGQRRIYVGGKPGKPTKARPQEDL